MNEHMLESRGIYYRTNEWSEGRPTIVFMHGLSGSSSAWLPHEQLVTETHNILSFDLRGHGKSKKYKEYGDYTMSLLANDLYQLIEFLKIEKFALITHSFGVLIALEFLKLHQDRVSAALFLSPEFSVRRRLLSRLIEPLFVFTHVFSLIPFNAEAGRHVDYQRHSEAHDWNIPMTYEDVQNTGLRIYLYCSKQVFAVDYTDLLPNIIIPMTLVQGKQDSIFLVSNSEIMAERIPHAKRILLDHADHIIVVNHIDRIGIILKEFVATLPI